MKRNKLYLTWMAAALLAMTGCSDELDNKGGGSDADKNKDGVYLTVNISSPTSGMTKAGNNDPNPGAGDPTGGEGGDGYETGTADESKISNAHIILYTGNDINDVNFKIVEVAYASAENINETTESTDIPNHGWKSATVTFRNVSIGPDYGVLVVTNAGNTGNMPLQKGANKEAVQKALYKAEVSNDENFVMSTHWEEPLTPGQVTRVSFQEINKTEPAIVHAYVERLAARIDFSPINNNQYTITNTNTTGGINNGATVTLTGIAVVNQLTTDSYLFKRVADPDKTTNNTANLNTIELLGDEKTTTTTANVGGNAGKQYFPGANFVIDPYHFGDKEADATAVNYTNPFDKDIIENAKNYFEELDGSFSVYTKENTMNVDDQVHGKTTGLIFKAEFQPNYIAHYEPDKDNDEISDIYKNVNDEYKNGFFRYNNALYKDLFDIALQAMTAADCQEFRKVCNNNEATGLANLTGKEVLKAINAMAGESLGYKDYLLKQIKSEALGETAIGEDLAAKLLFSAYLEKDKDITTTGHIALSAYSETGADNRWPKNVHPTYNIAYYKDGVCYYQYWIRHANNGDNDNMGIMEFAIVRNNIYKISVSAIEGLGMPDPFDGEDVKDENGSLFLKVNLYVKDWVIRNNEDIVLK